MIKSSLKTKVMTMCAESMTKDVQGCLTTFDNAPSSTHLSVVHMHVLICGGCFALKLFLV